MRAGGISGDVPVVGLLRHRARERTSVLTWNIYLALIFVSLLSAVVFLRSLDASMYLVGGLAVFGMIVLGVVARWRWKALERSVVELEVEFQGWLAEETESVPPREAAVSTCEILSQRELEILDKVARGMSNREISAAIGISDHTVKHHLSHVLAKLEVDNRNSAALMAMSRGWISPSPGLTRSASGKEASLKNSR